MATHLDASHRVFPPLTLNPCHPRPSLRQDHPLGPRSGREQREEEAWGDTTFSPRLMARCVVGKGPRCIHRSDAPNTMEQCVCSMPLGSPTVALVPGASPVKNMAPPPKNLVGSALSCIPCRWGHQKSRHLQAFLPPPLIPSCGVIGHAASLAEPGYDGNGATWSPSKPRPFRHLPQRLRLSRVLNERIGA